jgi:preprotein translocase subunit YajC
MTRTMLALLHESSSKSSGSSSYIWLILLVLVGGMFLFSRSRQKKQQQQQRSVEVGDQVMTSSGIIGVLTDQGETTGTVEISPGVEILVDSRALSALPERHRAELEDSDDEEYDADEYEEYEQSEDSEGSDEPAETQATAIDLQKNAADSDNHDDQSSATERGAN